MDAASATRLSPARDSIGAAVVLTAMCIPLSFMVGLRDEAVGTDTAIYSALYLQTQQCSCVNLVVEPIFALVAYLLTLCSASVDVFLGMVSAGQFILHIWLINLIAKLVFEGRVHRNFMFISFASVCASPFFLNAQTNILRQGLSSPAVVISALCLLEGRRWSALWLATIAVGIHYSAVAYLIVLPLIALNKWSLRLLVTLLAALYASASMEPLVALFSESSGIPLYQFVDDYGYNTDYRRGARYDFLAFSLMVPWLMKSVNSLFWSDATAIHLDYLEKLYLVLLIPFLVLGWGSFSDRYAYTAWLLLPIFFSILLTRASAPRLNWLTPVWLAGSLTFFISRLS